MPLIEARSDILHLVAIRMTFLKLNQAAVSLREYSVLVFLAVVDGRGSKFSSITLITNSICMDVN